MKGSHLERHHADAAGGALEPLPKSVVGKLLREPYWADHERRVWGA